MEKETSGINLIGRLMAIDCVTAGFDCGCIRPAPCARKISSAPNMRARITQWRLDMEFRRANQSEASAGALADRWENMLWKIALLSGEHTTEKRSYREDFKKLKMSTLTTNLSPQPAVYRAAVDRSLKKSRSAKDIPLPEVPKVIDNGNGRRYFRGRLLGKVSLCLVWITPARILQHRDRPMEAFALLTYGRTHCICQCSAFFWLNVRNTWLLMLKYDRFVNNIPQRRCLFTWCWNNSQKSIGFKPP